MEAWQERKVGGRGERWNTVKNGERASFVIRMHEPNEKYK